ncbi:MAG TPA: FAD-dependent monooxygenase, partial [Lautropia sp.]|nr:FAD-dependent monooxygenase [Lautropia sp.]
MTKEPAAHDQPARPPSESGTGYELPVYEFRLPPELSGGRPTPPGEHVYPLIIVGGGLAGLTAACDCAVRGIPAILLDEDNTIGVRGASSRGICYAQRTLEILNRLGVYERVRQKGIQWYVGRTLAGNDEVYSFDLASQPTHSYSCQPAFINIQQFYIEWYLVDRIRELGTVDLRWQSRVTGIRLDGGLAELTVQTPAGEYTVRGRYVIDATGIRSPLRDMLGLQTRAEVGVDRWCISDVRFRHKPRIERWTWIEAPFNQNRAVWQHLMADDVWRLDYQMAPDSDPEAVSRPEVVAERLREQFGEEVDYELVWVGPYGYRSHVMERFREGPVFFVGDCAHGMSPFGARGGNSGMQDADNLIWKLQWVMRGWAQESLLDSYDSERREGAEHNVLVTNRTARFLSPRSPAEQMIRNATIDLARKYPFGRTLVNTGRMSMASKYTHSALSEIPLADRFLVDAPGAGRPLQNVALQGHGDLVSLMRSLDGRLLAVAPDGETALKVELGQEGAHIPLARRVVTTAGEAAPGGWEVISAVDGASGSLAQALGLVPGRVLVIRPDLHSG